MKANLEDYMKATSKFEIKKWDESDIEIDEQNQKTTRATVHYNLVGQLEGLAKVEYLMFYTEFDPKDVHKGSARFTGIIWFEGSINGSSGKVAFEDTGDFGQGAVRSLIKVISGSGRGGLLGLIGEGRYSADEKGMLLELEYELKGREV